MIFIRLNDPYKILRDSNNRTYQNGLLESTLNKFDVSCKLFDNFFLNSMSNEKRWDFIEDFFLGKEADELMSDMTELQNFNDIDIIKTIKEKRGNLQNNLVNNY